MPIETIINNENLFYHIADSTFALFVERTYYLEKVRLSILLQQAQVHCMGFVKTT